MAKIIYRRLIELVLLFLLVLGVLYGDDFFTETLIFFSVIIIILILPVMVFVELFTIFSPIIRALLSLSFHILAIAFGFFVINFLGAVIQEVASNEIIPQTLEGVVNVLPYVIGLWVLDESLRFLLRESSSIIKWKSKSNG